MLIGVFEVLVMRVGWFFSMAAVTVLALMPIEHLQLPVFDWWDKPKDREHRRAWQIHGEVSLASAEFPDLISPIAASLQELYRAPFLNLRHIPA